MKFYFIETITSSTVVMLEKQVDTMHHFVTLSLGAFGELTFDCR